MNNQVRPKGKKIHEKDNATAVGNDLVVGGVLDDVGGERQSADLQYL